MTSYEEAPQGHCMTWYVCGMRSSPLIHVPHYSSFSGWCHFGTHPLVFVSLSGHGGVQRVYQLPSEFLRSCLYLHADVHHSHCFSRNIMKGWDETNPVSPGEQPAPPPGSHDFPLLITWRWKAHTRNGFPESLPGSSALLSDLSLPSVHPGPREEEGGGGKLWQILL